MRMPATRALVRALLALTLVAATIGFAPSASASSVADAVHRAYAPLLEEHDVPGIAVAVTVDGRQHFFEFGVADKKTQAAVTRGTYTAGGLPLQFPDSVTDAEQMTAYFQQFQPEAAPGAIRQYSNPSIGLLGNIAALALHGDFTHLLESQMLPSLGLARSFVNVPDTARDSYAWGLKCSPRCEHS